MKKVAALSGRPKWRRDNYRREVLDKGDVAKYAMLMRGAIDANLCSEARELRWIERKLGNKAVHKTRNVWAQMGDLERGVYRNLWLQEYAQRKRYKDLNIGERIRQFYFTLGIAAILREGKSPLYARIMPDGLVRAYEFPSYWVKEAQEEIKGVTSSQARNALYDNTIVLSYDSLKQAVNEYKEDRSKVLEMYGRRCPSWYDADHRWRETKTLVSDKTQQFIEDFFERFRPIMKANMQRNCDGVKTKTVSES